jgi:hypothetical protein
MQLKCSLLVCNIVCYEWFVRDDLDETATGVSSKEANYVQQK